MGKISAPKQRIISGGSLVSHSSISSIVDFVRRIFNVLRIIRYFVFRRGYLPDGTKKISYSITTSHYFLYLSHHRSSLPYKWILDMFHNHLEQERQKPCQHVSDIDSSKIGFVKQQLIECLKLKTNHILAGKCLSKCSLFLINNNHEENVEDDDYETISLWILEDLIMFYLIDKEQSIVECSFYSLKNLFNHPVGQDLYQKTNENDLIQIYSKPFLSQLNNSIKLQLNFTSSSNPWSINSIASFNTWLISLVNYLLKQIDYYYNEKKETGHPYAFLFLQLNPLIQLKIELAKKIFPHLIYCLLLLPINFNLRQLLTKNFLYLIEQLNENKDEKIFIYIQISKLIFRTINYLKQYSIENLNKRNNGKNSILNFQNHFWLDIDYFQLAKCASKYQCYQSAIMYTDIWTTKQRYILILPNILRDL